MSTVEGEKLDPIDAEQGGGIRGSPRHGRWPQGTGNWKSINGGIADEKKNQRGNGEVRGRHARFNVRGRFQSLPDTLQRLFARLRLLLIRLNLNLQLFREGYAAAKNPREQHDPCCHRACRRSLHSV